MGWSMRFLWWHELRVALVAMTAAVASFLSAWLIEDLAHLHTDLVVLAVVLAVMSARTGRAARPARRATAALAVVTAAVGAGQVGSLMDRHTVSGDTLFVLAVAAAIWIRRFGPVWSRLGTEVTLPFVAILVTPVPPTAGLTHAAWTALIAAVAVSLVAVSQLAGHRLGVADAVPHTVAAPTPAPAGTTTAGGLRPVASTRMAVQMGLTLAAAFAAGHQLYPDRWTWLVLTAYIVASGNRGRGDVVCKGILRVAGAATGTAVATLLAGSFNHGDNWAVVAIFLVLTLGTWLREFNYACWAGCVTAALAFLYGYFGQSETQLIVTRLEGILYGAGVATTLAWFVLPIKTNDVLRRRIADTLAALSDYLTTARRRHTGHLPDRHNAVDHVLRQLHQAATPTLMHRRLIRNPDAPSYPRQADAILGLLACRDPLHRLTQRITDNPDLLRAPDTAADLAALQDTVTAARRSLSSTAYAGDNRTTQASEPPDAHPSRIPEIDDIRECLVNIALINDIASPAR